MELVLSLGQAHGEEAWRAGPKAANLSLLKDAGFPVPSGFVLTTDAMGEYLRANGLTERVGELVESLEKATHEQVTTDANTLRELVLGGQVPDALVNAIQEAYQSLGSVPVSVRSSSTMEDRAEATFAGQHDTFLNIRAEDELCEAVKRCWASLWTDRAAGYMHALGISPRQARMAVLVQEMVDPSAAGVAFTVNPVTGDSAQVSVSSAFGLGEATVSGQVTPDHVLVKREPLEVLEFTTASKGTMVTSQEAGGTASIQLTPEQRTAASVTEEQALQVAELALRVEKQMNGVPQDVEWAIRDGEAFLLQARPMAWARAPEEEGVRWESPVPGANWRRNWRLGEWLSEPVTPLFRTWMLSMMTNSREEMGTGELGWEPRRSTWMPQPWSCIVNGYYYSRQDRPPGFGVPQTPAQGQTPLTPGQRIANRGRNSKETQTKWREGLLPAYLERFQGHLLFDIPAASSQELLSFINTLSREAADFWWLMYPIGYGFEETNFNPYYESVVPENVRPPYSTLFVGFFSKVLEGEESLHAAAQRVKADPSLAQRFSTSTPEAVLRSLGELPNWFGQWLQSYRDEYGHQIYNLDCYFPTSGEEPEAIIATIQSYLRFETRSPRETIEEVAHRREEAVQQVLDALADQPDDQQNMRQAIEGFQMSASVREDFGFYMQRPWPLIRRSLLELGRRMVGAGVVQEADQVFFLEQDEVVGALAALDRSERVGSLADVAVGRRHTWEYQRTLGAPDRIPLDQKKTGMDDTPEFIQDEQGARVVGRAVGVGRARGRAKVVRSPDEISRFLKGDILVASAASPAFTPFLLLAAGMVLEAGGGASHSSLIARELGIPTVVNTGIATQVIRDGQMIEVDGSAGVVRLLD